MPRLTLDNPHHEDADIPLDTARSRQPLIDVTTSSRSWRTASGLRNNRDILGAKRTRIWGFRGYRGLLLGCDGER